MDNDCSGLADDLDADGDSYSACSADCNDADAGAHSVPAEVTGLRFIDEVTLEWDSAAADAGSATVHDVLAGVIAELPVGTGPSEACLDPGVAAPSTMVSEVPPPGSGYWYLTRGRNSCGTGTYGVDSDGTERTSSVCP